MEYFYELFEALPRCGPGGDASTRRAFDAIPGPLERPYILDVGCGPGSQTVELARISNGRILALDNHQPFLDELERRARKLGLDDRIAPTNGSMFDMEFGEGAFDVVWSEGALYIMGFRNGVERCRRFLKNGGFLAATEAVYLTPERPETVERFFEGEYPDIGVVESKIETVLSAGFRMLSHFTLPESSWLDGYYAPMERELSRLEEKYRGNRAALDTFDSLRKEIDFYGRYSEFYGYEFFVAQKSD